MAVLQHISTPVSYNLIHLHNRHNSLTLWGGNWIDINYGSINTLLPENLKYITNTNILWIKIVGYKYDTPFGRLIEKVKEIAPSKLVFINDDYHTFPNHSNKSHESRIIEDIIRETGIDYTIYDPEFNGKIYYDLPGEKIKYFNYYNDAWMYQRKNTNLVSAFNENRKYKLCNMNRREHKIRLMSALMTFDMKDVFTTCYHNNHISRMYIKSQKYSKENTEIALSKIDIFKQTDLKWDNPNSNFGFKEQEKSIKIIKDSYVSLTNESKWSGLPFYSEKTMKCWVTMTPYVLLSSPYTLKLLKDLGFKSFNAWWDESYDTIENNGKRFDAVMKIVRDLHALSFDELKQMLIDMKPILEHNQNHALSKEKFIL